jgi:hypothetical protein
MAMPFRSMTSYSQLDSREIDTLRRWTVERWDRQSGIVQKIQEASPQNRLWRQEATRLLIQAGLAPKRVRTWWNIQAPDFSDGPYPDIYPHKHAIEPGATVILYLYPGDVPAPLEVLT